MGILVGVLSCLVAVVSIMVYIAGTALVLIVVSKLHKWFSNYLFRTVLRNKAGYSKRSYLAN